MQRVCIILAIMALILSGCGATDSSVVQSQSVDDNTDITVAEDNTGVSTMEVSTTTTNESIADDKDCYHLKYHLDQNENDNWVYYDTKTVNNVSEAEKLLKEINIFTNEDFSFVINSIEDDEDRPIIEYKFIETYKNLPIFNTSIDVVNLADGVYIKCDTYANEYNSEIRLTKNMTVVPLPEDKNVLSSDEIELKFLKEKGLLKKDIDTRGLGYLFKVMNTPTSSSTNKEYLSSLCYCIVDNHGSITEQADYYVDASTGEIIASVPHAIN